MSVSASTGITTSQRSRLIRDAVAVLDRNWRGDHTVPSGELYPHQWSWDTAFIAIGRSWFDQRRAQQELEHLFTGQWSNGMVPHIVFNPAVADDAYFPGPAFWHSERAPASPRDVATSGITQPPLHARAVLEVVRQAVDADAARGFVERIYPRLAAQHAFLLEVRDVAGHGLAAIVHPWESGMDNSPAWDHDVDDLHIPPDAVPDDQRRDTEHADARDRPDDATYDRFVYLAARYRDAGYSDADLAATCPFLVEDPLFNSVLLWSLDAMSELAELVGDDPTPHGRAADRVRAALRARLWDPVAGRYCARDVAADRRSPEDTITSLMPVLDPMLPAPMVDAITGVLDSPEFRPSADPDHFMAPSFDLAARGFDPRQYWRGPIWINTDWLLWRGLRAHGRARIAAEIASSVIGLVRRSGWREYFDPFGGNGYGSTDFSWTAALTIDLLHRIAGDAYPSTAVRAR
jgi:hypothetical protein